jgi:hypothetical protein
MLRFVFARAVAAVSSVAWPAARATHVYTPRTGARGMVAYLRLGCLAAGTHFVDFAGFERAAARLATTVAY